MESAVFLTYSHGDYADVSELMIPGLKLLPKQLKKVLCTNTKTAYPESVLSLYDIVIEYPDHLMYGAKITYCLEKLDAKYIVFVHDIELVHTFNENVFIEVIQCMDLHDIDRLIFGIMPKQQKCIEGSCFTLTDAHERDIGPHWYTPYDVGPCIWKKDTLYETMKEFSTVSYRDMEFCGIQKYLTKKNIYAFTTNSNYKSIYPMGRPFTTLFVFIHILIRGKWLSLEFYNDVKDELNNLISTYGISFESRGFSPNVFGPFNRCV